MDISAYDKVKQGLKDHFSAMDLPKMFSPNIVGFEPSKPTYPQLIIDEIRNVPYNLNAVREFRQNIRDLGIRVDITAKQSGNKTKQDIARIIAEYADDYLSKCLGLRQVSWNAFSRDGQNGDLYHITIIYSTPYWEERGKFL